MKRILLILVLISFCDVSLKAQSKPERGMWSLTPRIGVNWSRSTTNHILIDMDDGKGIVPDWKSGIVAGFDVGYRYSPRFKTSAGLYYSNEGFKVGFKHGRDTESMKYMNLAITENFYLYKGLSLKAGLQTGYLLECKDQTENPKTGLKQTDNDIDIFHRWNLSIPLGIAYEYGGLSLDLQYNVGILQMYKHGGHNDPFRTRSIWLTLGYTFNFQ